MLESLVHLLGEESELQFTFHFLVHFLFSVLIYMYFFVDGYSRGKVGKLN